MKKKAPKPLSRAPDWLCPQCGKPLHDRNPLTLACPDTICGYTHLPFLPLPDVAEILQVFEAEVDDLIDQGVLTLRVRRDRLGRVLRVAIYVRDLWNLRPRKDEDGAKDNALVCGRCVPGSTRLRRSVHRNGTGAKKGRVVIAAE